MPLGRLEESYFSYPQDLLHSKRHEIKRQGILARSSNSTDSVSTYTLLNTIRAAQISYVGSNVPLKRC